MINVTKTTLPSFNDYNKYLKKIWKNNWITNNGEFSIQFQKKIKKFLNVKYFTPLGNGTLALQLAYKALHLKGEVITTPFTFPATTNSLLWEGLIPVFADIDLKTFNIDPVDVEKKITKKTSAIVAVHVFGNPCEVEQLQKIAKKYNLKLIYDAAHAFGVEYKGKSLLNYGDISTLSFHAAKTFHTIEGGGVITRNSTINNNIELLSRHGIKGYESVVVPGINARMHEFEAAMGLCLLPSYMSELRKRKKIYETYVKGFTNNEKIRLQNLNKNTSLYNYPYFPIYFQNEKIRNKIYNNLLNQNIRARKYFYPPCNEFPYIKAKTKDLKNSTKISHSILCLPIYADLKLNKVEKIISIITKAVA